MHCCGSKTILVFITLLSLVASPIEVLAQDSSSLYKTDYVKPIDVGDIWRGFFKKKGQHERRSNKPDMAILPTISYNPSFGLLLGGSIDGGMVLGKNQKTIYSTFGLSASVTTKGNVSGTARHNIFTPGNGWNLQGNWQITTMGIVDYGIGTGQSGNGFQSKGIVLNALPTQNSDSSFPIRYNQLRIFEKIYRQAGEHRSLEVVSMSICFGIYWMKNTGRVLVLLIPVIPREMVSIQQNIQLMDFYWVFNITTVSTRFALMAAFTPI
jgi:hypothetical protein